MSVRELKPTDRSRLRWAHHSGKSPKQPDGKRELAEPKSCPAYCYVCGHANAFGSPWP